MSVWGIVPARRFATGKSRLAPVVPAQREALARAMFERVVGALRASPAIDELLVATDGDDVAAAARAHGARVVRDAGHTSLGGVIDAALRHAAQHGARAAVVVMGDLPHIEADDLTPVVAALADAELVVVPDVYGEGTNALAMRPPGRMPTCFGNLDSFELHLRVARHTGVTTVVQRNPRLAFDVDLPQDLDLAQLPL